MDVRLVNRPSWIGVGVILAGWLAAASPERATVYTGNGYPLVTPAQLAESAPLIIQPPPLEEDPLIATSGRDEDGAAIETDLLGNDIMTAMATYKVDRKGSIYELHSPQTEVPRLGVPKS